MEGSSAGSGASFASTIDDGDCAEAEGRLVPPPVSATGVPAATAPPLRVGDRHSGEPQGVLRRRDRHAGLHCVPAFEGELPRPQEAAALAPGADGAPPRRPVRLLRRPVLHGLGRAAPGKHVDGSSHRWRVAQDQPTGQVPLGLGAVRHARPRDRARGHALGGEGGGSLSLGPGAATVLLAELARGRRHRQRRQATRRAVAQ